MSQPSIRVTDTFTFDQVRPKFSESIAVSLEREAANESTFAALKELFESSRGRTPVFLEIPDDDGNTVVLETGPDLKVAVTDDLYRRLADRVGALNIVLRPKPDRVKNTRLRPWENGYRRNGNGRNGNGGGR